ncbi:hypothetical protein DQ04_00051240 [Trypanosoma grayi]|uniref:hypothetical protein n=1 Tax=Trypanosoma grayi TaxID=71804 RepID=UPI0004F417F0|nr:hypothetical protein DQ04_00051240 [Trypanosoma grayi]KEG15529.1 hypothetical protein DQ04_00051240 [Trypanosoma grayi]
MLDLAHSAQPLPEIDAAAPHVPFMLFERHVNSDAATKRTSYPESVLTAVAAPPSPSASDVVCSVGSLSLRGCLDLLVKVQKSQSESVTMLASLRERLFPTAASVSTRDGPLPRAVVAFDEVDHETIRLRILEVKHAGLRPKLSEAIESVMLPFHTFFRKESNRSTGDTGGPLRESCSRVLSLQEQFMGLAQLQEEAMQSLGAQLSRLFLQPDGGTALYYYPSPLSVEESDEVHTPRERNTHAEVLHFLQQLEDVMASKQHIVVCLAMALRDIYDPAAPVPTTTTTTTTTNTISSDGATYNFADRGRSSSFGREDATSSRVSVSVSPMSTLRPSCSAPREESLRTAAKMTITDCNASVTAHLLPAGLVQECHRDSESGVEIPVVDDSPSPTIHVCERTRTTTGAAAPGDSSSSSRSSSRKAEVQPPVEPRPLRERVAVPESDIPRSPSWCENSGGETGAALDASPPPPLARCLEEQSVGFLPSTKVNNQPQRRRQISEKEADAASNSPSIEEVDLHSDDQTQRRNRRGERDVDLLAQNARLCKMLETKDSLILSMQERILGAVPLLIERAEKSSRSNSSTSSSSSNNKNCGFCDRRSSCQRELSDDVPPSRGDSASTWEGEQHNRDGPHTGRRDALKEVEQLKKKLAAHVEENKRLLAALSELKDEKQRWKHAARELKDDNKVWRDKEKAARARCEQLEDSVFALKKRLLTVEGTLMLRSAASPPAQNRDAALLCTSSGFHNSRNSNTNDSSASASAGAAGCGSSPQHDEEGASSPMRSRSRTRPPSAHDKAVDYPSSVSLQQKRKQLLAKLGKRFEDEPRPLTNSQTVAYDEDAVVEVSPLTEERVQRSGAAATDTTAVTMIMTAAKTGEAAATPSPAAVRIDRRLSPEYRSLQPECVSSVNPSFCNNSSCTDGTGNAQLSTKDVNRILAGARSLLRSISSTRREHCSGTRAAGNSSDSDLSDYSSSDDDNKSDDRFAAVAAKNPVLPLRGSISPLNGATSPCSSVSYSSAKKRAKRLRHAEKSDPPGAGAAAKSKTSPPPPPPLRQAGAKKMSTSSPPRMQQSADPRPPTAREALMRELRDQLQVLQLQHAAVLQQEEQLQLKREQVTAAVQQRRGVEKDASAQNDLLSFLRRFDVTQAKIHKNEARLREYIEIVRQQLKTLEDDLL